MEAGFMRIVEVGQYFMTKDTGDFRQFRSVACREYTLPLDDPASQPKGWIQGNMRIGPVLEVTTSFQHFKYGIELRIKSVNQDNSQSWVRISYGTNKYVIDSIKTIQKFLQIHKKIKRHKQVSRLLQPDQRQKQNHNRENLLIRQLSYSIVNNGLILGGQDSSRRQTVFFFSIDPRDKNHKDPEYIDFSVPRRAKYVHSARKKHKDAVFWVDINLAIKEGLSFYQTRSNAIILQGTLPAHCIP